MSPTPRAAAALALLGLSALVLPLGLVAALVLTLVVLTVYDGWIVRGQPELERRLPTILSRGVPAPIHIAVRLPRARRLTVGQVAAPALSLAPRQGRGHIDGTLTASVRGRHVLPDAGVRAEGPLGLGAGYSRRGGDAEVLVYPDLVQARRLARAAREGRAFDARRRARGPLGLGTDFESVRDWAPDDDIRHVNWRASWRLGRPMTNQYRLELARDLVFLLDTGRLMAAPLGERTRLDVALDAVAAVGLAADELGDNCGAIAFDTEIRRRFNPRRAGGRRAITGLFDIQPRPVESDYERAFREVASGKRRLVIMLCDLFDDAAARALIEAVPVLGRRHGLVIASVTDPELEAPLRAAPQEPVDVLRAAAAIELLDARVHAEARLRHSGATVIRAEPQTFPAACVRAYLRAKNRLVL